MDLIAIQISYRNFEFVCFRQELAELREEHRAVQEGNCDQEENMWRHHEQHRAELEDEKGLLHAMEDAHETTHDETELELEEARRKMAEEQALCTYEIRFLGC